MCPQLTQGFKSLNQTTCFLHKSSTLVIVVMSINKGFNFPLVLVGKSAKPV